MLTTNTFLHFYHCYVHFSRNHYFSSSKHHQTQSPRFTSTHTILQLQEVLDDGDRITIDKYERNTVLTVRKTTRLDSGKYKLVLTNSSGTCESIGDVVVLGKFFIISLLFTVHL